MEERNRINEFIEAVMKVAKGNYSAQIELSGKNDELDSLAMGLNMMIDDIRCEITERKKAEEEMSAMNEELEATSEELEAANEELKSTNEELQKREHELRERVKELSCLYGIDEISRREGITIKEALKGTVQLIPPSWQYPEITGCRIAFKDKKYRTRNFKETRWIQKADIIVNNKKAGSVEVCYLEETPEEDEGPFVKEERELINAIAERLGRFIARKGAEEALKTSEERFKILFEYAPDGYYLNDLKGQLVDGNRAAEELTGHNRHELIGKSFLKLKLLSLKEIPKAAALLAKNALGQPTGPDEFTLNRKDGTQVVADIRTYPVKIKGQTLVLGNVRDITKRKQAEEQLKASLEEKEVLLKEIHHRVKNNMQIIASLIRIQAADIKDEEIQDMFNEIHDRIRSMAVLYEMLYQSKDMSRVDLSEYIRRLTTHLVSMYRAGLGPISLKLDVKDVHLDVKRAIPCGLIITELVSNMLKHAFPDGRKGEIAVEMHPDKGKKYTLIVSDNGIGFPEELNFRNTKSLGMKLVVDLVKQINGTVDLSRAKGTEFKIVF